MIIGIIGSGNIGAAAARLFIHAGHEVAISNSRGPESLKDLVAELGDKAQALSVEQAAKLADVTLVAIPFGKYKTLPVEVFKNKIVIDAGNYYPDRDGRFPELDNGQTTSSELVAAHLQGARLVKAFNTIYFVHLAEQGDPQRPLADRRAIFIAGDDSAAKEIVRRLIEEIGFAAVDMGSLSDGGKRQQPGTKIYNQDLTQRAAQELLAKEGYNEHQTKQTMRPQPLIAVTDVEASSRWYQRLLGCRSAHGGAEYERLESNGVLIMQLHSFEVDHHHEPIGNPDDRPYGNGVLLWFEIDDFEDAMARAAEMKAEVVMPRHRNPPSGDGGPNHWECWLRDPDGYTVVLASPDGTAG